MATGNGRRRPRKGATATQESGAKKRAAKRATASSSKKRTTTEPKPVVQTAPPEVPKELKLDFSAAKRWVAQHQAGYFGLVTIDGIPTFACGTTVESEAAAWMDPAWLQSNWTSYAKQGKSVEFWVGAIVDLPENNTFASIRDIRAVSHIDAVDTAPITEIGATVSEAKKATARKSAARKTAQKRTPATKKRVVVKRKTATRRSTKRR